MITKNDLDNREGIGDGADPKDGRPAVPSTRLPGDPKTPRNYETEARQALTARIAKAKRLKPQGADLHCEDCFIRGRNAALRIIEGDE